MVIRGERSGRVLAIMNPEPENPINEKDYPPGRLIALTDPSTLPPN